MSDELLPWADEGGHVWELKTAPCVECPHCLFTFAAMHTTEEGYDCPNCDGCPDTAERAGEAAPKFGDGHYCTHHPDDPAHTADCYNAEKHFAAQPPAEQQRVHRQYCGDLSCRTCYAEQRVCMKCGHNNVNNKGECRQCIDWQKHECVFKEEGK